MLHPHVTKIRRFVIFFSQNIQLRSSRTRNLHKPISLRITRGGERGEPPAGCGDQRRGIPAGPTHPPTRPAPPRRPGGHRLASSATPQGAAGLGESFDLRASARVNEKAHCCPGGLYKAGGLAFKPHFKNSHWSAPFCVRGGES